MSIDEIAVMDGSKCICQLRGVRPFFSNKFDITQHKNYKKLSDFHKKNEFNIEKHVSCKLKVKEDDEFEFFEFQFSEEELAEIYAEEQESE